MPLVPRAPLAQALPEAHQRQRPMSKDAPAAVAKVALAASTDPDSPELNESALRALFRDNGGEVTFSTD
eukprot:3705825-Pleurochrysis_carterae.AAC.1